MAKFQKDDDLFQESSMSFGEHLEELRTCLFRASAGLFVGVCIGLLIGKYVVELIEAPLERALVTYYEGKSIKAAKEQLGPDFTPEIAATLTKPGMMFEQVLIDPNAVTKSLSQAFPNQFEQNGVSAVYRLAGRDIKDGLVGAVLESDTSEKASPARRIWKALNEEQRKIIALKPTDGQDDYVRVRALAEGINGLLDKKDLFAEDDLNDDARAVWKKHQAAKATTAAEMNWSILNATYPGFIEPPHRYLSPILLWRKVKDDPRTSISTFNAQEAFMIWMKAGLIAGVVLSSPWVFLQIWNFVAAGLYPNERRYVHVFLPFSIGLFLLGAAVAYLFVFDKVLGFLFDFNDWLGMKIDPRMSEWLGMVLWLPIGFGVSFQLPLVMLFIERIGIVSVKTYTTNWRIAIIGIFLLSGLLAPSPDPYSMCLMAVPLTVLYFGGILLCKQSAKRRAVATH